VGRQPVTFGQTFFWNPLDEFEAFDARAIDRDYKPGVDAARLDVALGPLGGLTVIGAAGRPPSLPWEGPGPGHGATWAGSTVLARARWTAGGWDLAAQGGKVIRGWRVGAGASGEAGPVEVRGEAVWTFAPERIALPAGSGDPLIANHVEAVAGLGHRFSDRLTLEAEYFRNGAGEMNRPVVAALRVAAGESRSLTRNLSGLSASGQVTPLLTASVAALAAWDDGSWSVTPLLTYSVADNSELLAGVQLNGGRRRAAGAEYAALPDAGFLEYKVYF
jgi:hypothetical protein